MFSLLSRTRAQSAGAAAAPSAVAATEGATSPRKRGSSISLFGRGSRSTTASPEGEAQVNDAAKPVRVRTPEQAKLVEALVESTGCDAAVADQALEASLWEMDAAVVLQAKLTEANRLLETEQKELLDQEVEIYVEKFTEAIEIQKKMQDMERVLRQEEEELQRQQRMVEIDRREAELYPEEGDSRAEQSMGDDAFTRDMKEHGLKHVRKGGGEVRITADMLPPALDVCSAFLSIPDCPVPDPEPEAPSPATQSAPPQNLPSDAADAGPVLATSGGGDSAVQTKTPKRRRSSVGLSLDGCGPRGAASEPDIPSLFSSRGTRTPPRQRKSDRMIGARSTQDVSFAF